MDEEKRYVWYASFGSNLFRDRFRCYIEGGRPSGSNRAEVGSRDCTLPVRDKPVRLPYSLYFAGWSDRWNGAGAFIDTVRNENTETWGRMYLITEEQFEDVVRQENGLHTLNVNLDNVMQSGSDLINEDSYYGNLLYAGESDGYSIFTFTNAHPQSEQTITKPSPSYLRMLISGFLEAYTSDVNQIKNYLYPKRGVNDFYTMQEIEALITEVIEEKA
ncbi:histone deacetylase [Pontibacillus halophilus JSM 076056 = DSM 19796]|uniref:Histone deacetylase n=1 Tax=Pontibacillus halophilus JSM 076056 = DSM 19796 TaxID=1385510 RepID=A0A0A5GNX2_9BACI|nr:hypothetical protein [Pontibacillus halophilus]KGX92865.1 histone deacetylase [Pontibacillus halophilus JSM 076056 = DSM 19796]